VADFREQLLLRFLAIGWIGMVAGLFQDRWDSEAVGFAVIYAATVALGALLGSPKPELQDDWEDLRWRDRARANHALLTGAEPEQARVRRVVRLALREEPDDPGNPIWRAAWTGFRAAVVVVPIVFAAVNGAPPGWVVAGATLPAAVFAFRVATDA
jgi:hypothetical protein